MPTREELREGANVGFWVIAVVAFCVILSGALWFFGVFSSGIKGQGDVIKQNNDATNRITTQAYFESLSGSIESYTVQLKAAGEDMTANPSDFTRTNYRGLYNTCVTAVNSYNKTSEKTLFKDWKTDDLPASYDVNSACPSTPIPTSK